MSSLKNSSDCCIEMKEISKDLSCSFYRFYESIHVGIAVVDCEGNCCQVNSNICKILGYSEPELLGAGFKELTGFKELGTDSQFLDKNSQEILRWQDDEKCCCKKDGSEVWISISPLLVVDPDNRLKFIVFQIDDITRQKKDDTSFRASRMSFDSIYENVNDGIVINEQVGKFLEANPAMCKKFGYRREELLQKTVTDFIALGSSKIFAQHVRELYRSGHAAVQTTAICKDNTLLFVELNMWLIKYKGKQAIFSIVRDIKE